MAPSTGSTFVQMIPLARLSSSPHFVVLKIRNVVLKFRMSGLNIPKIFHRHISFTLFTFT